MDFAGRNAGLDIEEALERLPSAVGFFSCGFLSGGLWMVGGSDSGVPCPLEEDVSAVDEWF